MCAAADLGGHKFSLNEWLVVPDGRRLTDRQLPETQRAATEGVHDTEDCRVAGKTPEEQLLSASAPSRPNVTWCR